MHTCTLYYPLSFSHAFFSKLLDWWLDAITHAPPYMRLALSPWTLHPTESVHLYTRRSGRLVGMYLQITLDGLAFCGQRNFTPMDKPDLIAAVNNYLAPISLTLNDFDVLRLDYCHNAYVPSQEDRDLLMTLWAKATKATKGQRQYAMMLPQTVHNANKAYYKGKRRNTQVYDKEIERADKHKAVQSHEAGVLRLEVQILHREIVYQCREKGISPKFDVWFSREMRANYLADPSGIFFSGDFYSLHEADAVIAKSGCRADRAKGLHGFLSTVSRYGIDSAKRKYNRSAYNYLRALDSYGINPIPIPARYKRGYLPNPFREVLGGGGAA